MSKVTIKDLIESKSLDHAAMSGVRGGCYECEAEEGLWFEYEDEGSYGDESTSAEGGYGVGTGTNNFYTGRTYDPDFMFVGMGMSFV
jgi:hypothetical protein